MKKYVALLMIVLALMITLSSQVSSAVVYVNADSPGPTIDGQSWETAYQKIQDGVNAAASGDEVWVAKGTYKERVTLKADVTLEGGYAGNGYDREPGQNVTIIDGGNSVDENSVVVTLAASAVVNGFSIINGNVGVFADAENVTISDNSIYDCGEYGIRCLGANPVIKTNVITQRDTSFCANAGIYCGAGGTVKGNIIKGPHGSGIDCSGSCSVTANRVSGCIVGIYCSPRGNAEITCNIATANEDAGIRCQPSLPTDTVTIRGNVSASNGRYGIYCSEKVTGILIAGNTIAYNDQGIRCNGASAVNNIIAFNSTGVFNTSFLPTQPAMTMDHNDMYENSADYVGNAIVHPTDISVDPQFVDALSADFHIKPSSLCRNAGALASAQPTAKDIDDQDRVEGSTIDIGADESYGESVSPHPIRSIYVDGAVASSGDGSSWTSAYKTIQSGIKDVLVNGPAAVKVAKGTYKEIVYLVPSCYLFGGYIPGESEDHRACRQLDICTHRFCCLLQQLMHGRRICPYRHPLS